MKISINSKGIENWEGSVLVIGVFEGKWQEQLKSIETIIMKDGLEERVKLKSFTGKASQLISFHFFEEKSLQKLIFVGLGSPEKLLLDGIRQAASIGTRASSGHQGKIGMIFPWDAFDPSILAKEIGEATRLTIFKDLRFKSDPEKPIYPNHLELIGIDSTANKFLSEVNPICSGVELARELVGSPPNSLTPSELAKQAAKIANQFNLKAKIMSKKECEEKGMGAYLAVAKGSDLEPKFIHLTYTPKGKINNRLVLIGKGLTFDSGGYNLKVGASQIEKMKYDMGGSAAVIGAARAIAEIKPKDTEVHFLVAACENMINGSALHPGDIITASNGKTIEVNNTDAEGRLTLADALVYACNLKPDAIVDLATLTGACVIALGDEIAGLWTENDQLSDQITNSAEITGESVWRMPMKASYKAGLKSPIADLQNTGPRAGGSITAALFLKEFVDSTIPWAHLDIAGTCWTEKDRGINPSGATGFGVRILVNWICNQSFN